MRYYPRPVIRFHYPIHRGLEDGPDTAGGETRKERGESWETVGFDTARLHFYASDVQDVDDTLAIVVVDACE